MFSGIQEILVLVIIILGILFLPRVLNRGRENRPAASSPAFPLSGRLRLALTVSIIWPALIAAYLQPWKQDLITYLYVGPGPVVLLWLVYWVITGFKRK
jgi:hypothetical protein